VSHFTVIVVGDDVEGQLEPFDENQQVSAYTRPADLSWWVGAVRDDPEFAGVDWDDPHAVVAAYNKQNDDDPHFVAGDGTIVVKTTYNPDSKWDWWVVGGRWTGYFKLKPGANGSLGRPGTFDNKPKPGYVDQVVKGAIDFDAMRDDAGQAASEEYDHYEAVIREFGPLPSSAFVDLYDVDKEEWTRQKTAYWQHPGIKALSREVGISEMPDRLFAVDRETYVQRARNDAGLGYAFVYQGEWIAPGNIGWWAASDDTAESRAEYAQIVTQLLDSLPDDTLLTLVDCHI